MQSDTKIKISTQQKISCRGCENCNNDEKTCLNEVEMWFKIVWTGKNCSTYGYCLTHIFNTHTVV